MLQVEQLKHKNLKSIVDKYLSHHQEFCNKQNTKSYIDYKRNKGKERNKEKKANNHEIMLLYRHTVSSIRHI